MRSPQTELDTASGASFSVGATLRLSCHGEPAHYASEAIPKTDQATIEARTLLP